MNERIKQLAEQAGAEFIDASKDYFGDSHPAGVLTDRIDLQKFVDLIVLESSKWIVDNSIAMEQLGPEFFAMGLCKHFGVK